jgi:hypothetical protein
MASQISHTSSGEWQSFEGRMRRRRAERCILRAEVAAEAGCLDEARDALDEARKLAPGLPEIAAVEANIFRSNATIVSDPATLQPSRFFYYATAVLVSVAVLSMGFMWWQRTSRQTVSPPAAARERVPGPSTAITTASTPRASRDVRIETVAITAASVNEPPIATKPVSATLEARADSPEPPVNIPEPLPRPAEREPVRREPAPADAVKAVMRDVAPVRELALASTSTALAAPVPMPAPPPPRIDENSAVRTVLHRYADAYSRLDASAAQQVWPGVNRVALSRAFDGLASQDISLGKCAVDVSGESARATCAGAATWAPKVGGGGARTEPRAWTFQLAKAGADWQIVNARVQNR